MVTATKAGNLLLQSLNPILPKNSIIARDNINV